MFRFFSVLLLAICLMGGGYASLAPYAQSCAPADSECFILLNTRIALSQLGNGIHEFGINSLEPMFFKNITMDQGIFKLVFEEALVAGAKDCKVEDIQLSFAQSILSITLDCPLEVIGKYNFNGNLYFYEANRRGNYVVKSDSMRTTVHFKINTIHGANGNRYWKLNVLEYVYEPQEALYIQLDNLFTGEVSKESPFFKPSTSDWWPTVAKAAEPTVSACVGAFCGFLESFFQHVPLEQLSNQKLAINSQYKFF